MHSINGMLYILKDFVITKWKDLGMEWVIKAVQEGIQVISEFY